MPLKLYPPRPGKSPNYSIRGTYLGVGPIDRTTGTSDRRKANEALKALKAEIERGAFVPKGALTFAEAALAYLKNGGDPRFLDPLTEHFMNTPMMSIGQDQIDEAAHLLYPDASPATRNRQVYTPMSAIMQRAKMNVRLRRPKGAQGEEKTEWMTQAQAERLLNAAEAEDVEFRAFLALLCYTGLRLSEALAIECEQVDLEHSMIFIPKTKNGEARAVHIAQPLVVELANHPRGLSRKERLFRFNKNGRLYTLMRNAKKTSGLPNVTFHTCRHTWATWMRRFGKLDTKGLVGTGAWKDEKSASRYQHVVVTEEAQRADMLPVLKRAKRGKIVE